MSSTLAKIKKEESFDDFEFFDADGELDDVLQKSPIHGAVEKLGSGVAMIFSALCTISEDQGLVVTLPVKAMATTAATTITGSLLGGIPGMAVGLVTGAVIAYRTSPKRSQSLSPIPKGIKKCTLRQVINQMTIQQKKELIRELLGCLKKSNVRLLITEIFKNEEIRNIALCILTNFLKQKMGISLCKPK